MAAKKTTKKKVTRKRAPKKKCASKAHDKSSPKNESQNGSGDIFSPEVAQAMLKADMGRILQKVKDKKPLTAAERNLLQQKASVPGEPANQEEVPEKVPSISALCGILGIDRSTFYKWRKRYAKEIPANFTNGNYDVNAWREFIRRKGLIQGFDSTDDEDDGEDIDALKRRDLKARAREREFKLEILKGDYLHKDDVRESITSLVNEALKLVRDKLENELPPVCAGLDAVGIRKENARVVDEFCKILHQGGNSNDE